MRLLFKNYCAVKKLKRILANILTKCVKLNAVFSEMYILKSPTALQNPYDPL